MLLGMVTSTPPRFTGRSEYWTVQDDWVDTIPFQPERLCLRRLDQPRLPDAAVLPDQRLLQRSVVAGARAAAASHGTAWSGSACRCSSLCSRSCRRWPGCRLPATSDPPTGCWPGCTDCSICGVLWHLLLLTAELVRLRQAGPRVHPSAVVDARPALRRACTTSCRRSCSAPTPTSTCCRRAACFSTTRRSSGAGRSSTSAGSPCGGRGPAALLRALLVTFHAGMTLLYAALQDALAFPGAEPGGWAWGVASALQVAYAWLACFGLLGLFRRIAAWERFWVHYLSVASYWLYLCHLLLVIAGQLLTVSRPGWVLLKLLLIVIRCGRAAAGRLPARRPLRARRDHAQRQEYAAVQAARHRRGERLTIGVRASVSAAFDGVISAILTSPLGLRLALAGSEGCPVARHGRIQSIKPTAQ